MLLLQILRLLLGLAVSRHSLQAFATQLLLTIAVVAAAAAEAVGTSGPCKQHTQ
jgi:hypothetical protein